jgi:hypothetical protein
MPASCPPPPPGVIRSARGVNRSQFTGGRINSHARMHQAQCFAGRAARVIETTEEIYEHKTLFTAMHQLVGGGGGHLFGVRVRSPRRSPCATLQRIRTRAAEASHDIL